MSMTATTLATTLATTAATNAGMTAGMMSSDMMTAMNRVSGGVTAAAWMPATPMMPAIAAAPTNSGL